MDLSTIAAGLTSKLLTERTKAKAAMAAAACIQDGARDRVWAARDLSSKVVSKSGCHKKRILCSNDECYEACDLFCENCGNPYCSKSCQKKHWYDGEKKHWYYSKMNGHKQWCSKGDHRHRLAHIIKRYLLHYPHEYPNTHRNIAEILNATGMNRGSFSHCVSCNNNTFYRDNKTMAVIEFGKTPIILSYPLCPDCDTGVYDFCNIHCMMHKGDELCTYPGHTTKCRAKCKCGFYEFIAIQNKTFPRDILRVIYDFVWPNKNRSQEGIDTDNDTKSETTTTTSDIDVSMWGPPSGDMLASGYAEKSQLDFSALYPSITLRNKIYNQMDIDLETYSDTLDIDLETYSDTLDIDLETGSDILDSDVILEAQIKEMRRRNAIRCFEEIATKIQEGKIKLEDLSVTLSQILLKGGYLESKG